MDNGAEPGQASEHATHATTDLAAVFDRHMLEALICPQTHDTLTFDAQAQELISPRAGLAFPIRSGIPVLLIDEARRFEP